MFKAGLAVLISLLAVGAYYVVAALVSIGAQKYFRYDKPNGLLNKVIDFPTKLPEFLFERLVPLRLRLKHSNGKEGYLRKQILFLVVNVLLYSIPVYFLIRRT